MKLGKNVLHLLALSHSYWWSWHSRPLLLDRTAYHADSKGPVRTFAFRDMHTSQFYRLQQAHLTRRPTPTPTLILDIYRASRVLPLLSPQLLVPPAISLFGWLNTACVTENGFHIGCLEVCTVGTEHATGDVGVFSLGTLLSSAHNFISYTTLTLYVHNSWDQADAVVTKAITLFSWADIMFC